MSTLRSPEDIARTLYGGPEPPGAAERARQAVQTAAWYSGGSLLGGNHNTGQEHIARRLYEHRDTAQDRALSQAGAPETSEDRLARTLYPSMKR